MQKCDHCNKQCELPFHCSYCGGSYCSDHRLPPSHNCINEDNWKNRTSGLGCEGKPKGENPSLPLKACFYCGVKTSRIFYCPLCGHDFCSVHKLHQDHCPLPHEKFVHPESSTSMNAKGQSKDHHSHRFLVTLSVIVAMMLLVIFILSLNTHTAGSDTINPPITARSVTENSADTIIPQIPIPTRIVYPRPMTGTIITGNNVYGGEGELTIDNLQGGSDAIAVLTNYGRKDPLISVYLRSGEIYKIEKIADGKYELFILYGENWNASGKKFEDNPRYTKFDDPFQYTTTETTTESTSEITTKTKYTTWSVTLYNVVDGNANTEELSKDSFPKLE